MSDTIHIAVLAGTTRAQRKSIHAARFVEQIGRTIEGITVELVDPMDFTFAGDGNDPEGKDPRYTAITERADAFFIVSPEYNHSFPSSLKRMLDSELSNYIHKPVAFAGCSSGMWGGVRGVEALVSTVREMGMVTTFSDVYFPKVQDVFNEAGELQVEFYTGAVTASYTELIWMAKTLKYGREQLPSKYHQKAASND